MKIIEILKTQLDKEIKNAEQGLNGNNLDAIFKLTTSIHHLEKEHEKAARETRESGIIKRYSNGRYDHNIDALHDAYVESKRKYREVGDKGHRDKVMDCLCRLTTEVYDMFSCVLAETDFREEKEEAMRCIRRLAEV